MFLGSNCVSEARRYHGNRLSYGRCDWSEGPLLMGLDSKGSWESGQSFGSLFKCLTLLYFERTVTPEYKQ